MEGQGGGEITGSEKKKNVFDDGGLKNRGVGVTTATGGGADLDSSVWGSWMFSMVVFLGFHWDSTGLAAARMEVRAFSWQMIPAFAHRK